jgi:hypothetical protein
MEEKRKALAVFGFDRFISWVSDNLFTEVFFDF